MAVASCVGLVISASVVVVIVGRVGDAADDVVGGIATVECRCITVGAITAVSCAAVGLALFYAHLSTALHLFWSQQHRFLEATPVHRFVPRLVTMAVDRGPQDSGPTL